ncbi:MAG: hypothetical protein M1819_006312 [Sarea resinae]|nr:MAG: hypothetical protein M1819_006312 [Sarea resinae]
MPLRRFETSQRLHQGRSGCWPPGLADAGQHRTSPAHLELHSTTQVKASIQPTAMHGRCYPRILALSHCLLQETAAGEETSTLASLLHGAMYARAHDWAMSAMSGPPPPTHNRSHTPHDISQLSPLEAELEMYQKGSSRSFLSVHAQAPRPLSEATEFYDTDFEDDFSDTENTHSSGNSRRSDRSSDRKSDTTISTYDEVPTPGSNHLSVHFDDAKSVEGPKGPHLFRMSDEQSEVIFLDMSMALTPLAAAQESKLPSPSEAARWSGRPSPQAPSPRTPLSARRISAPSCPSPRMFTEGRRFTLPPNPAAPLGNLGVQDWSPQQVASWMYSLGFEGDVVEKFEINDISGAVLVDLHFEDLKELDIQSFGKRHRVMNEINNLRDNARLNSIGAAPVSHEPIEPPGSSMRRGTPAGHSHQGSCESPIEEPAGPIQNSPPRRRRVQNPSMNDIISPAESVSIVAIEQLLPKIHKCSKGENCSKWRRQQRQFAKISEEIGQDNFNHIIVKNRQSSPIAEEVSADRSTFRPTSEAQPSIVASSDVFGPGQYPEFRLEEEQLRVIESRDPQENVQQFLNFQLMHRDIEEPPTPPLEMFPPLHPPKTSAPESLKSLPKLAIPRSSSANEISSRRVAPDVPPRPTSRIASPPAVYRHGTPCSEMDVPVTAVQLGPIARDASQSVPPNMQYRIRDPVARGGSRNEVRRPSFAMERVDEHTVLGAVDDLPDSPPSTQDSGYAGWMKKRKTKFLRHEWHDNYFTLKDTKLSMHKDNRAIDELDHIDVDNYAIACSSLESNKLNAAFKSLKIAAGKKKAGDPGAFAFQLIPSIEKKGFKAAATGKTHHFAVKTRDERIDWMRELMLAKALKQKDDGYEINVNGNAI